ncbi:Uma2 family endonuclease [Nocardia aurantia]|nr:Uma2 family endonuclease [Nocardia aurantia]
MTALPVWTTDSASLRLTEEIYAALPEETRRSLEVIDGHVMFCRRGEVEHSIVARRLAQALDANRPTELRTRVVTDFEMHFRRDRPTGRSFSFRRPAVALHQCFHDDRDLITSEVLLVAEVVSPGFGYVETVDKVAEYADEGIPIYLVVHLDTERKAKIIQEHRLDRASNTYRLVATHQDTLCLSDPFEVVVPFADLDAI